MNTETQAESLQQMKAQFGALSPVEKAQAAQVVWNEEDATGKVPESWIDPQSGKVHPVIYACVRRYLGKSRKAFDNNGFDANGIHRNTLTYHNKKNFNKQGIHISGRRIGDDNKDIFGYARLNFSPHSEFNHDSISSTLRADKHIAETVARAKETKKAQIRVLYLIDGLVSTDRNQAKAKRGECVVVVVDPRGHISYYKVKVLSHVEHEDAGGALGEHSNLFQDDPNAPAIEKNRRRRAHILWHHRLMVRKNRFVHFD